MQQLFNDESLCGKDGILAPLVKCILEMGREGKIEGYRVIYTTNIIEDFHHQFPKATNVKEAYLNDAALMRELYLSYSKIAKK